MISQVRVGYHYINVSVGVTDDTGKSIDPVSAEALFYKISQGDGSLALDTNINGDGKVTLLKQDGQTGFYGGSVDIASLSEAEYIILYKVTIDSVETITVESLSIDRAKKEIEDMVPLVKRILGLSQENLRILIPVYDADHQLISATIKTYPTKTDCENDTNPIAEYNLEATYNVNGECTSYKLVKV